LLVLQYLRLFWAGTLVVASVAVVVGILLAAWWYPVNYLLEGKRYHERFLVNHMRHAGFEDVVFAYVDIPDRHLRDFECKSKAWVTTDGGKTYHPIAFQYDFDRSGWLEGKVTFLPTENCLKYGDVATVDHYLEWFGHSREVLLRYYEPEQTEETGDETGDAESQTGSAA